MCFFVSLVFFTKDIFSCVKLFFIFFITKLCFTLCVELGVLFIHLFPWENYFLIFILCIFIYLIIFSCVEPRKINFFFFRRKLLFFSFSFFQNKIFCMCETKLHFGFSSSSFLITESVPHRKKKILRLQKSSLFKKSLKKILLLGFTCFILLYLFIFFFCPVFWLMGKKLRNL